MITHRRYSLYLSLSAKSQVMRTILPDSNIDGDGDRRPRTQSEDAESERGGSTVSHILLKVNRTMTCISGIPINDLDVFGCQDRDFIERRSRIHATAATITANSSNSSSFVVFKSTMLNRRHRDVNDVYYTVMSTILVQVRLNCR